MVEDVRSTLNNSRQSFELNVQDRFGQSIIADVFEPCDGELQTLQEAVDEAHNEQQFIRNLLDTLRVMI
ncbi:MAG: hypothetical protein IJU71_07665 [Selenomonadaceae bacterium]|nr:hypothetical protein [Selenomonadaceae bacterium]